MSDFVRPAGACATQQRNRPARATASTRLTVLAGVARDLLAEADRLDRERGEEYDVEAEATADALRAAVQGVQSVLHPDADLFSSAARQHYIDSGVYPTRTETQEV